MWLALWPVAGSILSLFGAIPAFFPALVYFADSPLEWRVAFLVAGISALIAAWLLYGSRLTAALGVSVLFALIYIPVFPVVWGQTTITMAAAVAPALLIGYLRLKAPRREA